MTQSAGDLTIDTYEYDRGKSAQDFDESGFAAEVLFLPWQPLIWAAVAESRGAQKGTLTITYDGNNRVVKVAGEVEPRANLRTSAKDGDGVDQPRNNLLPRLEGP